MSNKEKITAWERVEIARNPKRKTAIDYIEYIFDEFIELHGDRVFKDDKAIVCGLAKIGKQNFTIIAEQKGRNTKENIERNFGMPNPESYRKAVRFMKQAEKLMLENAIYSILSPEGYSSILWKDATRYEEAAEKMKLTAKDLYDLKVVDKIIKEPLEMNEEEFLEITESIKKEVKKEITKMLKMTKEEIVENRYEKFRKIK